MPSSRPKRLLLIAGMIAMFVAAGCASAPKVFSNQDAKADFSSYRTFGFYPRLSTDNPGHEALESNFLKVAVAQQLDARGLSYSEDPDLLVNFYINTEEKIHTREAPTMTGYYGFREPFYDPWSGYNNETTIEQYTEGTLNIDVVDTSTNSLVWEGAIVGRVTESTLKNLEAIIDDAVAKVFAKYPIRPVRGAAN